MENDETPGNRSGSDGYREAEQELRSDPDADFSEPETKERNVVEGLQEWSPLSGDSRGGRLRRLKEAVRVKYYHSGLPRMKGVALLVGGVVGIGALIMVSSPFTARRMSHIPIVGF